MKRREAFDIEDLDAHVYPNRSDLGSARLRWRTIISGVSR
jgi:hypothetical protein